MVIKKTIGEHVFDVMNTAVLILFMVATIYPIWYIVVASLSDSNLLLANNEILYRPLGFSLEAYKSVFQNPAILIGYRNTVFYVVVGTTYNIIMTSLGAFVLSRKNFLWKKYIMTMIVINMFFSGGLIPTYLLIKSLGLLDTVWVLIFPGAISTWNLIIMRTAFMAIPDSLEESAKIDGANDLFILVRIIIPLALPTMAVMVLYYGVSHWNSWFDAMIYLRNRNLFPLQLYLREILINNSMDIMMEGAGDADREALSESLKFATIIVATLPILFAYPFLQKYFVKGVMVGAIKG